MISGAIGRLMRDAAETEIFRLYFSFCTMPASQVSVGGEDDGDRVPVAVTRSPLLMPEYPGAMTLTITPDPSSISRLVESTTVAFPQSRKE